VINRQQKWNSHRIFFFFLIEIASHYVVQASLELKILLPLPLSAGITGVHQHIILFSFFFLVVLGLNSGSYDCSAGTLALGPHLQSILLWLFWRQDLMNCLPWLDLNCDPLDLNFGYLVPSS
jgi:hypothetical protein